MQNRNFFPREKFVPRENSQTEVFCFFGLVWIERVMMIDESYKKKRCVYKAIILTAYFNIG